MKKVVLKNFPEFTERCRPATLLKRDFNTGVLLWIFEYCSEFLRIPILNNIH